MERALPFRPGGRPLAGVGPRPAAGRRGGGCFVPTPHPPLRGTFSQGEKERKGAIVPSVNGEEGNVSLKNKVRKGSFFERYSSQGLDVHIATVTKLLSRLSP